MTSRQTNVDRIRCGKSTGSSSAPTEQYLRHTEHHLFPHHTKRITVASYSWEILNDVLGNRVDAAVMTDRSLIGKVCTGQLDL